MKRLKIMLELTKSGAHLEPLRISSGELAERIECSQQTASRWLNRLSEKKLIEKNTSPNGQIVEITPDGVSWLESLHQEFHEAFGLEEDKAILTGEVTSGFGEGSYYMNQENYQKQFVEKLGFEAYPGTLDVELDEKSTKIKEKLENMKGIKIEGFSTKERSFGGVKCFLGKLKNDKIALVLPERNHHRSSIVELISPNKIRSKYNFQEGDEVKLEVET